jgi:hypothetical protein
MKDAPARGQAILLVWGGMKGPSANAVSHPKFEEQGIDRGSSGVKTR